MTASAALASDGSRLSPLFEGGFAWCLEKMRHRDELPSAVPIGAWLEGDGLEQAIETYGRSHAGADRRAVASMWSMYYFATLTIPSVVAAMLPERGLPVAIEDGIALDLAGNGLPNAFGVQHEGASLRGAPATAARFRPLIEGHLRPIVALLASRFGLSAKLVWCNAAAYIDYAVHLCHGSPNLSAASRAAGDALLGARFDVDGRANPLFGAIRRVEEAGETVRRRKVCCLRYLLPGVASCGSLCALPSVRNRGCGASCA